MPPESDTVDLGTCPTCSGPAQLIDGEGDHRYHRHVDLRGAGLGATFRDKITGFTGVAVGRVKYLSGCNQTLLVPPVGPDGSLRDSQWFDDQRLTLDTSRSTVTLDNGPTPGCDKPAPKR